MSCECGYVVQLLVVVVGDLIEATSKKHQIVTLREFGPPDRQLPEFCLDNRSQQERCLPHTLSRTKEALGQ